MILVLIFACVSPAEPQTLESVVDAPMATARDLTFSAVAHPDYRGEIHDTNSLGTRWFIDVVIPLLPPGASLPEAEVPAWVTHKGAMRADRPMGPWLERVRTTFNGQTTETHHALPKSKRSGWAKAIAEAEKRHGIRSHPDAPVFWFE